MKLDTVAGYQLLANELEKVSNEHRAVKKLPNGLRVIYSEIGNCLMVGHKALHEPNELNIPPTFPRQSPGVADPVEVAIQIQL